MAHPDIPTPQKPEINESDNDKPEKFWTRRRVGGLALAVISGAMLAPKVYAEGAKMSEDRSESYSWGQFWRDMRGPTKGHGHTERDQGITQRVFIYGKDGWRPDEQGVNDLLGASFVAGSVVAMKGVVRRASKKRKTGES